MFLMSIMSAKEHYDEHLGAFYEWMAGDFAPQQKTQEDYFRSLDLGEVAGKLALDLEAAHGLQTISLLNMGYEVKAVDFNRTLLDSLEQKARGRKLTIIESDILSFLDHQVPAFDLILCMGDTLPHLESFEDLDHMIRKVYSRLRKGGSFVLSFRDYQFELKDTQRFIPVRSDQTKIHTCFLEYFEDKVRVSDILYKREGENWIQSSSSYWKLRLGLEMVQDMLTSHSFELRDHQEISRLHYLHAVKE
ncbi:MAG: methyltransferase domain-containing protein [Bacteroidota bacterium]